MGKYIKKGKIAGDVIVTEISHQSSIGVRTRARTLALQRLLRSSSPAPSLSPAVENEDASYLELRSRKLEKASVVYPRTEERESVKSDCNPCNTSKTSSNPVRSRSRILSECSSTKYCAKETNRSFDDNAAEFESEVGTYSTSTREMTPCRTFVKGWVPTTTPDNPPRRTPAPIPRQGESLLDDFFSAAEHSQHKLFVDKYNFDPVNDRPLPGRYEWVRLDP